jgi:hypothetical protein
VLAGLADLLARMGRSGALPWLEAHGPALLAADDALPHDFSVY